MDNFGPQLSLTIAAALPELAVPTSGDRLERPTIVIVNDALAEQLGFSPAWVRSDEGINFLTGQGFPAANGPVQPVALAYSGHQFGSYSPILGDGRALLLGDVEAPAGLTNPGKPAAAATTATATQRYEIHAKGTGRTVFSRGGDGKCTLAAAAREYLISEAMFALGVPTTRALAIIATGESIDRPPNPGFPHADTATTTGSAATNAPASHPQPGAIIVRVASSFLRVGTFELVSASSHDMLDDVVRFAAQTIPVSSPTHSSPESAAEVLENVVIKQADLIARWMSVGFVHGVMNTDNCAISGETLDYGPCAFVDEHDPRAVFSSIDRSGRYAFAAQPQIAAWNCACLAQALLPQLELATAQRIIDSFADHFAAATARHWLPKLGIPQRLLDDADSSRLLSQWRTLLSAHRPDHTLAHRALLGQLGMDDGDGAGACADFFADPDCVEWVSTWKEYLRSNNVEPGESEALIRRANPIVIPRNFAVNDAVLALSQSYQIDQEVQKAEAPEAALPAAFDELLSAVTAPFTPPPPHRANFTQPTPAGRGQFTSYCGT